MQDLDCQVVPLLSQQLARLALEDDSGSVMGIDDAVADLEVANFNFFQLRPIFGQDLVGLVDQLFRDGVLLLW